jgi:hypothetical protein
MSLFSQKWGSFWNDDRIIVWLRRMRSTAESVMLSQLDFASLAEFTPVAWSSFSFALAIFRSAVSV